MKIDSVKLVYFSPTGTTKKVLQGIARGLDPQTVELIDVTPPEARQKPFLASGDDLLVIGVPVYRGRVPPLVSEWLNSIQAHDTPTVCVVVYGNRAFDDALLELKDIVAKRGCLPVAGGAYIGEHSFSDSGAPIAPGRPDEDDLRHAEGFGREIREKLLSMSGASQVSDLHVPGTFPYGGSTEVFGADFIAIGDFCERCGTCAEVCPVGIIDPEDGSITDYRKCIACCACIKTCPHDARTMKSAGPVKDAQQRLTTNCKEPRTPECFL